MRISSCLGKSLFRGNFVNKRIAYRTILSVIVCLTVLVSSTAQTQNSENNFDATLAKWLAYVGFKGDVLEYQKVYDDNGYIDYFRILLQEAKPTLESELRTPAKILLEMTDNEAYQFAHIKVTEKDISKIPLMKADWIAKYAISYAVKNITRLLQLEAKTEKVKDGLHRVSIKPAKTSVPSRYRFSEIEIFYEVHDLFLSLDVTIKGDRDYLILTYFKSELNGILRALENGNFPGATSEILASGLPRESSDYLIRDLLKVPEVLNDKILELERNPGTIDEGSDPEFQF